MPLSDRLVNSSPPPKKRTACSHKAPRSHMIVVVDLPEGSFVADPGLGGLGCARRFRSRDGPLRRAAKPTTSFSTAVAAC